MAKKKLTLEYLGMMKLGYEQGQTVKETIDQNAPDISKQEERVMS